MFVLGVTAISTIQLQDDFIDSAEDTQETVAATCVASGRLPRLIDAEPRAIRWTFLALAIAVTAFFLAHMIAFWTPAHPGVDQNGYLVGGKLFAKTLTMRFSPVKPGTANEFDPHQFVASMWVGTAYSTPQESYYPKYPLGYPLLIAISLWSGGAHWGPIITYWINPAAMALAVLATFLLARVFVGSLMAILTMLAFATSPATQGLATNPNSHATAVCFVTWGMLFLMRWWQAGRAWRAIGAGLLLGFAATIRYTEATLILAILFVGAMNLRPRDWRSWRECGWVLFCWAIPVGLLAAYNLAAIGHLTGYEPTNESTGFRWEYVADNWETLLRHLNTYGLCYLFPVSMAGVVWMFWWNWRVATCMVLWIAPCLLAYLAYYWAPNPNPQQLEQVYISYVRFFLTIIPALSISTFWFIERFVVWSRRWRFPQGKWRAVTIVAAAVVGFAITLAFLNYDADQNLLKIWKTIPASTLAMQLSTWIAAGLALGAGVGIVISVALYRRAALPISCAGVLTAAVIASQLHQVLPLLEADQLTRLNLDYSTTEILAAAPAGSVVFATDQQFLHHLQFVGGYTLYGTQSFMRPYVQGLPQSPDLRDDPQGLDPGRRDALYNRLKDLDQRQLDDMQRDIVDRSLNNNLRVFVLLPRRDGEVVSRRPNARGDGAATVRQPRPKPPDALARILTPDKYETEAVAIWSVLHPRGEGDNVFRPRGVRVRMPFNRRMGGFQLLEVTRRPPEPPAPKPAPKPASKPAVRPMLQPASRPAAAKPTTRPTAIRPATTQPATKPTSRPLIQTATKPATSQPATRPTSIPPPATRPATFLTTQPASRPD